MREAAEGPLALYEARCAGGLIRPDPAQARAAARLDALFRALTHPAAPAGGWVGRLFAAPPVRPKGLYLWGPVGRGKSMLMDLFFAAAPVANKRRVHFHAFMLEVPDRLEMEPRARPPEPVGKVAADLAASARLLCFD